MSTNELTSDASEPLPSLRLAGVSFEQQPASMKVYLLLGGVPLLTDPTFTLRTLTRELTVAFHGEELSSMTLAALDNAASPAAASAASGASEVSYPYSYTGEAFIIEVPTAHVNVAEETFTVTVHAHGRLCGEWSGTAE